MTSRELALMVLDDPSCGALPSATLKALYIAALTPLRRLDAKVFMDGKWHDETREVYLASEVDAIQDSYASCQAALDEVDARAAKAEAEVASLRRALAEARAVPPQPLVTLVITRLRVELCAYLDTQVITSDSIGELRRRLFMPWDSEWNGLVRYETALREKPSALSRPAATEED